MGSSDRGHKITTARNIGLDERKYEMLADIFPPAVWVTLAGALFTLGYLVINQVLLRLVLMVGSFCYIGYYATAADTPLWGAIYGSILMICTNLLGLCALYLRNASISVPNANSDIYHLFAPVRPGDFRALMRLGERQILTKERILTREGEALEKLYYIVSGTSQVVKGNSAFPVPGPVFVGEVAYLLQSTSSATTIVPAGAEIIVWDVPKLRKAMKRRPRIELALDAVISKDLATKVYYSVAPQSLSSPAMQKEPANSPAPLKENAWPT